MRGASLSPSTLSASLAVSNSESSLSLAVLTCVEVCTGAEALLQKRGRGLGATADLSVLIAANVNTSRDVT